MLRPLPVFIEPDQWILAFHRTSKYWWVRWLALGRYKHVSAFAWLPAVNLWVVYDVTLVGTKILILPDSAAAMAWLSDRTADADLVRMSNSAIAPPQNIGELFGGFILAPFSCVSAIRHLTGIPAGALPSGLYRAVIAHGGTLIDGRPADPADRPGHARAGTAGAD